MEYRSKNQKDWLVAINILRRVEDSKDTRHSGKRYHTCIKTIDAEKTYTEQDQDCITPQPSNFGTCQTFRRKLELGKQLQNKNKEKN